MCWRRLTASSRNCLQSRYDLKARRDRRRKGRKAAVLHPLSDSTQGLLSSFLKYAVVIIPRFIDNHAPGGGRFSFFLREALWPRRERAGNSRSEEHTSELQSLRHLVC